MKTLTGGYNSLYPKCITHVPSCTFFVCSTALLRLVRAEMYPMAVWRSNARVMMTISSRWYYPRETQPGGGKPQYVAIPELQRC